LKGNNVKIEFQTVHCSVRGNSLSRCQQNQESWYSQSCDDVVVETLVVECANIEVGKVTRIIKSLFLTGVSGVISPMTFDLAALVARSAWPSVAGFPGSSHLIKLYRLIHFLIRFEHEAVAISACQK
jgi:hypothetical protein